MSASLQLLSLPDDVLKLVMQHVPVHDRLQHACLANRRLHAVAVAATQEVRVYSSEAAAAIQWLERYGQHVTRLLMSGFLHPLRELPCPSLLQLELDTDSNVQLGPSAAAGGPPGVLQACTGLTSLDVLCTAFEDPEGVALNCLSHLVGLRHLRVLADTPLTHGLSAATLPRLSHLTSMVLRGLSLHNLGQLGALSSLQALDFSAGDVAVGPGSVPGLAFPAALTSLQLWSPVEADLFARVPTGLRELHIDCEVVGPAAVFLSGIARLQQLTEFDLHPGTPLDWPPVGPAYSALTASSSLDSLWLEGESMVGARLPEGVWPFVFPAAHSLPHLTYLSLCEEYSDTLMDPAEWGTPWGPADVSSLVRCCPKLQDIHAMHLWHGQHVSQLHTLSALTRLLLLYGPADVPGELEWSLRHLSKGTQLQSLCLIMQQDMQPAALLPLTQLKSLTNFQCTCLPDEEDAAVSPDVVLFAQDVEPDVYVQLLEHCAVALSESDTHSAAAAEAMASLAEVSAQQRQDLGDSGSLVACQKQQLAALQQQVSVQQQLITAQQQQIAVLLQSQPQPQAQSEPSQAAIE